MIMKSIIILFTFIIVISITESCSPVRIIGDKANIKNHKRMVLLEFIIAPHVKSSYSWKYNNQLAEIAPSILQFNDKSIDEFELFFGETFADYSKLELLYGDTFRLSKDYVDLKKLVNLYDNSFDDQDFPVIHFPSNSYNFFPFKNLSNPTPIHPLFYFIDKSKLNDPLTHYDDRLERLIKQQISKICGALNVDGAVIVVTGVVPIIPSHILISAAKKINLTQMFIYDATGKLFLQMDMASKDFPGDPKDFISYQKALKYFYRTSDFILSVLFDKEENSVSSFKKFKGRMDKIPK